MRKETATKRHEFLGVLLLMLTILLLVCLISFNRWDASANTQSYRMGVDNRAGRIGAYVSDWLFQILGFSSFLLVLPMAALSWNWIRGKQVASPLMRILGFFLLVCASCAALQRIPIPLPDGSFQPGGVIGNILSGILISNLNTTGAYVVVGGMFLLGLLAATPFSIAAILNREPRVESPARIGIWRKFQNWRMNRKPVRAVINVRGAAPPLLEPAQRPVPIRVASTPADVRQPSASTDAEHRPQAAVADDKQAKSARKFILPPIELLTPAEGHVAVEEPELMERARQLAEKCAEFDVRGSITQIHPGPVVTTFEFKPDAGIKYSKITSLVDDLCLGVKAESIRIDRIPGKATVGIEIPNTKRETILLRELIESDVFRKSPSRLTLALGKLINGNVYVTELGRMPHLLIAGATGSGKSVALNCMITSILYKATPEEVRFVFIDPKRLELGIYEKIPHLLTPIVTDATEAANALRWATNEMEARYKKLALRGVRNIDQYNTLVRSTGRQLSFLDPENNPEGELEKTLPYLVLVIDELADLMMVSSHDVEESIARLAAMARAVGIHLILATQRPSVDVITGVIKANFPCRIAFKVATKVDSRTIIDANGAEQLLGNGDMLFVPPGSSRVMRIHGAYVSEKEAQNIVEHLRRQGRPMYDESVLTFGEDQELDDAGNPIDGAAEDSLYKDAVRIVVSEGRASTSLLQRRLSIGYGRAAKLIDVMHTNGLVGPADGSKPREVLVGMDFLERLQ
ncbi:MAG: DNA translocase FtsK 4TM domain-containing protein [Acidobacteriota bacterium]|jgi:S-DNA-T family DNA segregation ATPase FtsK/SpoIIIE